MPTVPFDRNSFNKCLCGGCPVNRSSACVEKQEKSFEPFFEPIEKEGKMPDAAVTPGIYCAGGRSGCEDLEGTKRCLCPACAVHLEMSLGNSYYCLKGSAKEVG